MPPTTFIFAGGGTGGHLFPGLAIAELLHRATAWPAAGQAVRPTTIVRCLFLCSNRPLDTRILTDHQADFRPIPAQPLGLHPRRLACFLANWGKSIQEARAHIREARAGGGEPVHLVAMGGFVAAPAVQAARVERIPITLINLDAVPGKANRWIARHSNAGIFTAAPVTAAFARQWQRVPPIVRREAVADAPPAECRRRLGLDETRPTFMITGGSQGARSINDLILAFAQSSTDTLARWQIIHQCGADADAPLRDAYSRLTIPALVEPFVARISDWWGAADLAISRSGAGSVAEAWANHVPTLFLPYPYHRDQHQRLNAQPLVDAGGALLAADLIDPTKNLAALAPTLRSLLTDAAKRSAMRSALLRLGPADGADRIARTLLSVAT